MFFVSDLCFVAEICYKCECVCRRSVPDVRAPCPQKIFSLRPKYHSVVIGSILYLYREVIFKTRTEYTLRYFSHIVSRQKKLKFVEISKNFPNDTHRESWESHYIFTHTRSHAHTYTHARTLVHSHAHSHAHAYTGNMADENSMSWKDIAEHNANEFRKLQQLYDSLKSRVDKLVKENEKLKKRKRKSTPRPPRMSIQGVPCPVKRRKVSFPRVPQSM